MATVIKLRSDIKKLKKAIETKGISDSIKSKLKVQLEKVENELAAMQKGGKPRKVSTTKGTATALSALQKLIKRKKYGVYQGKGVDLKKDANEGAMATGRRVSKGLKANQFGSKGENKGNVYYEYRPNRLDVKQPRKAQRYPKLEKGGVMAKGGFIAFGNDDFDTKLGTFETIESAKKFAKANKWKYETITFEDLNGDTLVVSNKDSFKDIDWIFSDLMEKGGEIESGAKRLADNPNWTNEKLKDSYDELTQTKKDFEAGKVKPSKIIGGGYKSSAIARRVAKNWLDEQIDRYKLALELRGVMMAKGGSTKTFKEIKREKLKELEDEISNINSYLKKLEQQNTQESYKESQNLRNYKSILEAKKLHLEDEMSSGGMMAKGGELSQYRIVPYKKGEGSLSNIVEADFKMAFTTNGSQKDAEKEAQEFIKEHNDTHPSATITKIHPSGNPLKNKKVSYVTKDEIQKFEEGGEIPEGYHQMPDGSIMADSEHMAMGGMVAGRYYKDAAGNELRFIGESGGMGLFRDKDGNAIKKDFSDFIKEPKESKLFGWFEKGGSLKNDYKGMSEKDVWDSWDYEQKFHFLLDHRNHKSNPFGISINDLSTIADESSYEDLPKSIKLALSDHIQEGRYKYGGIMAKGGSLSSSTQYVPNRSVKELSVIIGNSLKNLKGSDIVDGVYVKKSALSSLSKKVAAKKSSSSLSVDDVYNSILKKAEELGGLDAGDEKKIKKTDIKKLINAGYNGEDINIIYLGADALEVAKIDKEYSAIDGLMSYREDAIPNYIDRYVKAAKDGKFEIGLKYPEFNWSDIEKKYKISKDGKEIDGKVYDYGDEKEHYVYTIFEGENVVIGTSTNRVRYKNGVKQPEDNYYKRDPKELAKFQGGYWGIVSSSKDVIKDIARMILRKGTGYVKDVNVFINALGGVDSDDLDKNNIKYERGGYNTGAGWASDRARHNKSEDYEIPMNKRKLEDGGVISKTHRIG